ncbi:MAG: FecR family protein [Tannerellaceae bacterium]|nr:FecR family protein [Tannerellaceae bacterium]
MIRICAAVALILLVTAPAYYLGRNSNNLTVHQHIHEIEVPLGSRTKTTLPDGTVVWLNAGSRMTYTSDFPVRNRDVSLVGEGYFEVIH